MNKIKYYSSFKNYYNIISCEKIKKKIQYLKFSYQSRILILFVLFECVD